MCADAKGVASGAGGEVRSCRVDLDYTESPGMPTQPAQSFVGNCLVHRSPLFQAFAEMTCAVGFSVFPKLLTW